jgi:tetratricopeptide (TPR) repeat protein
VLDRGTAAWSEVHVAACRATRVEGRQSDTLLDLRMKCLDRWLDSLGGLASELEKAGDPAHLEGALSGMTAIPPLEPCDDATALQAELPPPDSPADRAEADAIVAEVRALQNARHAGSLAGLKERADVVVARARKLNHPPTLVKALGIRWRLDTMAMNLPAAVAGLREDVEAASRAHDGDEETKAWALQVRLLGRFLGRIDEAKAIMTAARSACARAGDPPLLRAEVLTDEADAYSAAGEVDHALADLAEAQQLLVKLGADQPGSPQAPTLGLIQHSLATTYYTANQLERANTAIHDTIATYDRAYGPETLETAGAWLELAEIERDALHYEAAERAVLRAIHIRETRNGPSTALAAALSVQADITSRLGHPDDAVVLAERAVAMARSAGKDSMYVMLQASLADAYDDAGRKREALATYDEVLAGAGRERMDSINIPNWLVNRGEIARSLGDCKRALDSYAKAREAAEHIDGKDSRFIGSALRGEGFCLHTMGKDADAIAALEAGIAYKTSPSSAQNAIVARGLLGELLVDTGRDRTRGLAMAKDALAKLHELKSKDPLVPRLEAWSKRQP